MIYQDVISLAEAKEYLGVDDTSHDAAIQRAIDSALATIEKMTGHIFQERDIEFVYIDGKVNVYEYPIISTTNTTANTYVKPTHTLYAETDSTVKSITIKFGYTDKNDIPPQLIEAGYQYINSIFNGTSMAAATKELIATHRRFIV